MVTRWKRVVISSLLLMSSALPAAASQASTSPAPAPAAASPAPSFQDVPAWHWEYDAVEMLLREGVITPSPQRLFHPEAPIRRAELFKMVLLARRMDAGQECQAMFRDVPCDAWYAASSEAAFRMGIADGVGVDLFGPNQYVSRQQLFTIIVRALGRRWETARLSDGEIESRLQGFADRNAIQGWARSSVALAVREGIAHGYRDRTFRPDLLATRAEAAALVGRILLNPDGLQSIQVDGKKILFGHQFNMTATMYSSSEPGLSSTTYTGLTVRVGAVAVDPEVIALGSLLYVEGYGYAIAADIGGAVQGRRIDLFSYNSQDAAWRFGVQSRRVWVLP